VPRLTEHDDVIGPPMVKLARSLTFLKSDPGVRHPRRIPSDRQLFDKTFAQLCILELWTFGQLYLALGANPKRSFWP